MYKEHYKIIICMNTLRDNKDNKNHLNIISAKLKNEEHIFGKKKENEEHHYGANYNVLL